MINYLSVHLRFCDFSVLVSLIWLISIAGLGFRFGLGHRFLYYGDTMRKGSESESESVETCSA